VTLQGLRITVTDYGDTPLNWLSRGSPLTSADGKNITTTYDDNDDGVVSVAANDNTAQLTWREAS
jgi:hypothetical protein